MFVVASQICDYTFCSLYTAGTFATEREAEEAIAKAKADYAEVARLSAIDLAKKLNTFLKNVLEMTFDERSDSVKTELKAQQEYLQELFDVYTEAEMLEDITSVYERLAVLTPHCCAGANNLIEASDRWEQPEFAIFTELTSGSTPFGIHNSWNVMLLDHGREHRFYSLYYDLMLAWAVEFHTRWEATSSGTTFELTALEGGYGIFSEEDHKKLEDAVDSNFY